MGNKSLYLIIIQICTCFQFGLSHDQAKHETTNHSQYYYIGKLHANSDPGLFITIKNDTMSIHESDNGSVTVCRMEHIENDFWEINSIENLDSLVYHDCLIKSIDNNRSDSVSVHIDCINLKERFWVSLKTDKGEFISAIGKNHVEIKIPEGVKRINEIRLHLADLTAMSHDFTLKKISFNKVLNLDIDGKNSIEMSIPGAKSKVMHAFVLKGCYIRIKNDKIEWVLGSINKIDQSDDLEKIKSRFGIQ